MDLLLEKKWPEAAILIVPQNLTQKRILLTVSQPLSSLHLHPYHELFAFFDPDIVFVRSSLWSCSADYCPFSPWHSFIVLFLRYELITESTWKIKYFFLKRKIPWSKIFNMICTYLKVLFLEKSNTSRFLLARHILVTFQSRHIVQKMTLTHLSIFWEMGNDEYWIMPNYHTDIMISIADENLSISLTEWCFHVEAIISPTLL